jgi:serine/threonine protein kinase
MQGLVAGDILAGKYRVENVLGVGGMGMVVAAMHLQLEQRVAIKCMLPEALGNVEATQRFLREARAAVKLRSEHVCRVFDVGTLDNGSPYMVMEHLEGTDLDGVLHQRGAIPVNLAVEYVLQACEAVAEAHALGIVHRDLKPGNLFLTYRPDGTPFVKVLDFGISKAIGVDLNVTRTTTVMGSPAYMSPEQMRSTKLVDGRTDIWALGIILYQLVSGKVPFQAETFTELCLKVAMDPLPAMPPLPYGTPSGFEAVVRRALEKDQALRFSTVSELAQSLMPYAPHRGSMPQLNGSTGPQAQNVKGQSTITGANGQVVPRRRTGAIAAAVGVVVAGGAALAIFLATRGPKTEPTVETPIIAANTVSSTPVSTPASVATPVVTRPDAGIVAAGPPDAGMVARPESRPESKPETRPTSISKPTSKPTSRPVSKPVSKPTSKPTSKPIYDPLGGPD